MKIGRGGMEGTPEEIRDTFENHGLRLEDYLEKPEPPLSRVWLVVPSVGIGIILLALVLLTPLPRPGLLLLFLSGVGLVLWLTVAMQIKFKNAWATGAVAIIGVLMLLVAGGFIEPREMPEIYKELKK